MQFVGGGQYIGKGEAAPARPAALSLDPASGPEAGGTSVTIGGYNFRASAVVTFGGVPAVAIIVVSDSEITGRTPAGSGVVDLVVTNVNGLSGTLADAYQFIDGPMIESLDPGIGLTEGGDFVTITGTGFRAGATVFFGENAATSVVISETEITCMTPAGPAGLVSVTVRNDDGQSAVLQNGFFYIAEIPPLAQAEIRGAT